LPWGSTGLIAGLVFLLAGGRREDEAPWATLVTGLLALAGLGLLVTGLVGIDRSVEYVPRLTGVAVLGIVFWWADVGRLGPSSDRGYRLGQLLGVIGLLAIAYGIGRSALPPL